MTVPVSARLPAALLLIALLAGCDRLWPDRHPDLPTAAAADSLFRAHGVSAEVKVSGNVVEVSARQSAEQLRRGGALWAKVGPYIYLFSPATSALFEEYPAVAAVRTRTLVRDREVASALLTRDTMRAGEWGEVTVVLARALREGTSRPSRLEELVRWGERFTTYRYDPEFAPVDSVPGQ